MAATVPLLGIVLIPVVVAVAAVLILLGTRRRGSLNAPEDEDR